MPRIVNAFEQFFDSAGNPLIEGKLNFFESGSSTVRKTTFADVDNEIENINPVLLTADGRAPNVFGNGSYRVILTDAADVQILFRDPVGGQSGQTFGADWNSVSFYDIAAIVRDDDQYWESLSSENNGNRPSTDGEVNWGHWPPNTAASETVQGILELATQAETDAGVDDLRAVTPLKLKNFPIPLSSETVKGILELATQAETDTGTDNLRAVTPLKLAGFGKLHAAAAGFQKFAGGLIVQWGTSVVTLDGSGDGSVTLPVAYPSLQFTAVVSNGDAGVLSTSNFICGDPLPTTALTFSVRANPGAATVRVNWLSIGN